MENKKVLIHIGSPKTGTSSIQSSLLQHSKSNNNTTFCYPVIDNSGHQNLEILFKNKENLSRSLKSLFINKGIEHKDYKSHFEKEFSSQIKNNNQIILSSEYLFNFNMDNIIDLKNYITKLGCNDFMVLLYLRTPDSYYLSLIQQKLKASYLIPSPLAFKSNYYNKISNWVSVFGKKNIKIKEFSKSKLFSNDIVSDFSKQASAFFENEIYLEKSTSNESLSSEEMILLQKFRKSFFEGQNDVFKRESNLLIKQLAYIESKKTKPTLKEKYKKVILNSNKHDLLIINKEFGLFNETLTHLDEMAEDVNFNGNVAELLNDVENHDIEDILLHLIFNEYKKHGKK